MSSGADKKSGSVDPLLVLIALLLLLAAGAALYFMVAGPTKEFVHEPGARPRPIITNQTVVVNVQQVVVGTAAGGHGAAVAEPAKPMEAKPAPETKPADAAPAVAAVALNPPAVTATTDGKILGRVVLKGTPAPEKAIGAVKADANCGKVEGLAPALTRNYVVGPDGGLRYALVRIVKAPAGGPAPAATLIDQHGCMYEPYVSATLAGQPFKVKNSDAFMHNVNATPKVSGNKGFNIAQANKDQVNEKTFDAPELGIRFACNVHPWMIAYLHVLENPFFAVTNDKGEFELPAGLPPGKYELEVNHLKAGVAKQEIEVAAGKGAQVVFEMAPGK